LKAKHSCIREVRGMGLMLAMELDSSDKAKAVVSTLLKKRILINRTHETVLRFLPPYIIEENHVDEVIRALDSALTSDAPKQQRVQAVTRAQIRKRKEPQ
jgi:acetylornithine/N-succinyldiaminopimelate aminotransferase